MTRRSNFSRLISRCKSCWCFTLSSGWSSVWSLFCLGKWWRFHWLRPSVFTLSKKGSKLWKVLLSRSKPMMLKAQLKLWLTSPPSQCTFVYLLGCSTALSITIMILTKLRGYFTLGSSSGCTQSSQSCQLDQLMVWGPIIQSSKADSCPYFTWDKLS